MKGTRLILIIVIAIIVAMALSFYLMKTMIKDEQKKETTASVPFSTTVAIADTVFSKNLH
ncbi:hypothetical protein P5G51_014440 [Virgibacillus sp. 179-BFC.A HS]|uniref:Uncharacterized protein n=1 Tax=Tigheibacillus jepli TaxID=3035914 RepID=A0ABU5CJA5_9BACI|nr:hypothetical protein [Virgibacillus sp. 179-BFC.A HS]MDY0406429.1 hypothetical protein [Virgibacillus sp. 179-BFC.A HS]